VNESSLIKNFDDSVQVKCDSLVDISYLKDVTPIMNILHDLQQ